MLSLDSDMEKKSVFIHANETTIAYCTVTFVLVLHPPNKPLRRPEMSPPPPQFAFSEFSGGS